MADKSLTDLITELKDLNSKATPGEWTIWNSCSWSRIGIEGTLGETAIEPCVATDGHPDLVSARNLEYICFLHNNTLDIIKELLIVCQESKLQVDHESNIGVHHLGICSASRSRPIGDPGCICLPKEVKKQIIELKEELYDLKSVKLSLDAWNKDLCSTLEDVIESGGIMDTETEDHAKELLGWTSPNRTDRTRPAWMKPRRGRRL